MKYYLIAGEASGDLHASRLMRAIKEKDPLAVFRFFGGDLMADVGGARVKHYKELAYMGFIPVLLHLKTIFRNMALCKRDIVEFDPDVLILIAPLIHREIYDPQTRILILRTQSHTRAHLKTQFAKLLAHRHGIVTTQYQNEVASLGIGALFEYLESVLRVELVDARLDISVCLHKSDI